MASLEIEVKTKTTIWYKLLMWFLKFISNKPMFVIKIGKTKSVIKACDI